MAADDERRDILPDISRADGYDPIGEVQISQEEQKFRNSVITQAIMRDLKKEELLAAAQELVAEDKLKLTDDSKMRLQYMSKKELLDTCWPRAPQPAHLSFFSKCATLAPTERRLPPLQDEDLINPVTKRIFTLPQLKQICVERNIDIHGLKRKDEIIQKLKTKPGIIRNSEETEKELFKESLPLCLKRYVDPPLNRNSPMGILYHLLEEKICNDAHLTDMQRKEIKMLRPHVLAHLDKNYIYWIIMKGNFQKFVFHWEGGIRHWQGDHQDCWYKQRCPQRGKIISPKIAQIVKDILEYMSRNVMKEFIGSVWSS